MFDVMTNLKTMIWKIILHNFTELQVDDSCG